MIAFNNWLMTQDSLKEKHAIKEESKYEKFYITGEDLEKAFKAGMQFHSKLVEELLHE